MRDSEFNDKSLAIIVKKKSFLTFFLGICSLRSNFV